MSLPALIDTHCHVDYIHRREGPKEWKEGPEFTNADAVLQRALDVGVKTVINPGTHPDRFDDVLQLADAHENLYAALAIHPCDVQLVNDLDTAFQRAEAALTHPKVVAIGETGLDYYHDTSHIELQKRCFRRFLAMAVTHNQPVIIHDRDAHDDVAALVDEFPGVRGVMHCFGGDASFAEVMMAKGFYISFAGNVTFKNAHPLHEAAKIVPLDKLLIETDSPFLAPAPHRGKPSEAAYVLHVAEKVAELKGIPLSEVAAATTHNAKQLFGI